MNEVSADDLVTFDGFVQKWQRILNLSDWRIERGVRRPKHNMAQVSFYDADMLAMYRVGTQFGSTPVNADSLERTAVHELLHIRLRKFKLDQSEANEHEIVNTLEKLLMDAKL